MVSEQTDTSDIQARYAPTASNPVPTSSPLPPVAPALKVDETTSDFAPPLPPRPDQSLHVRRPSATSLSRVEEPVPSSSAAVTASVGPSSEAVLSPAAGEILGDKGVKHASDQPLELGPVASNDALSQDAESEQQPASTVGASGLVLPPGAAPAASSTGIETPQGEDDSAIEKEIMAVSSCRILTYNRSTFHPRNKTLNT